MTATIDQYGSAAGEPAEQAAEVSRMQVLSAAQDAMDRARKRYAVLNAAEAAWCVRREWPTAARVMFTAGDDAVFGPTTDLTRVVDAVGCIVWDAETSDDAPDDPGEITDRLANALRDGGAEFYGRCDDLGRYTLRIDDALREAAGPWPAGPPMRYRWTHHRTIRADGSPGVWCGWSGAEVSARLAASDDRRCLFECPDSDIEPVPPRTAAPAGPAAPVAPALDYARPIGPDRAEPVSAADFAVGDSVLVAGVGRETYTVIGHDWTRGQVTVYGPDDTVCGSVPPFLLTKVTQGGPVGTVGPEVLGMLYLNLRHLPEGYAADGLDDVPTVTSYPLPSGVLLYVPAEVRPSDEYPDRERPPASVHAILAYARRNGCDWVMFDGAGNVNPELRTWHW